MSQTESQPLIPLNPLTSNTDCRDLYESYPLINSSTSIRVLRLDTSPNENTDDACTEVLSVTLEVIDLSESPDFSALSYVWGEYSEPRDTVHCDGYRIPVTGSCYSALRQLRKENTGFKIWIDAICINQADVKEKSKQIPLMRTIYQSARMVYVWLGPGTDETDKGMEYLARGGLPLDMLINRYATGQVPTGNRMALRLAFHLLWLLMSFRWRSHFVCLQAVLERPWIERLWTLQEALLPANSIIMCGDKSIPWISMVYAVEYMDFCRSRTFLGPVPPSVHNWRRLVLFWIKFRGDEDDGFNQWQLQRHRRYLKRGYSLYLLLILGGCVQFPIVRFLETKYHNINSVVLVLLVLLYVGAWWAWRKANLIELAPETQSLRSIIPYKENESIMVEIQTRKSSSQADKYYAVYGIIGNPRFQEELAAANSLGAIYQSLFIDLLRYTNSLNLLLFGSTSAFENYPSWVVDWRGTNQPWIRFMYWSADQEFTGLNAWRGIRTEELVTPSYSGATLKSASIWNITPNGQLVVHGARISQVSWSSTSLNAVTNVSTEAELLRSISVFLGAKSDLEPLKQKNTISNIARLVTSCSDDLGSNWSRSKDAWLRIMLEDNITSHHALEKLRNYQKSSFGWSEPWSFHLRMTNFLASEKMALFRCGSQTFSGFGLAPVTTREGDEIALVSGISMPIILRQDRYHSKIVGPAFLPGVLDGEIWKDLSSGFSVGRLHDIVLT